MALQMGVSLALAFAIGRALYGAHWSWLVMTAFIVCSGNRGRADVVYKSGLRIGGAAAGTVAATLLAGQLAPGGVSTVVVIFVVLGLASWLRSFSYAYWAAGITSVLALLYGYFGESGTRLLAQRLEGIVIGALIAVAVSWLLVPVRTSDVLRRRIADALLSLSDFLEASSAGQSQLRVSGCRFDQAVAALDEIAKPLQAHRLLTRRRAGRAHAVDAIDALRRCLAPVATIVDLATADPEALTSPAVASDHRIVASKIVAARRALAGRHEDNHDARVEGNERGAPRATLESTLAELDAALTGLAASYPGDRSGVSQPKRLLQHCDVCVCASGAVAMLVRPVMPAALGQPMACKPAVVRVARTVGLGLGPGEAVARPVGARCPDQRRRVARVAARVRPDRRAQ
jgi:uncharacterized membrane protein YccC